MFSGCLCVCPSVCVSRMLLAQYLEKFGRIFTKLFLLMHFVTRMYASSFRVKRSKVKVTAWVSSEAYRA